MRPVSVTKVLAAASDNAIALNQTLGAAGNLVLNGATGTGNLDTQRRIRITSSGNDSTVTATVIGKTEAGAAIRDSFTLSNGSTADSNIDFFSVASVSLSAAAAANVKVGTNGVGSTQWFVTDDNVSPYEISFSAQLVTGTANATVEITYDPVLQPAAPQAAVGYGGNSPNPVALPHPQLQSLTASQQGQSNGSAIHAWRLTINSGTGTWKVTARQSGLMAA